METFISSISFLGAKAKSWNGFIFWCYVYEWTKSICSFFWFYCLFIYFILYYRCLKCFISRSRRFCISTISTVDFELFRDFEEECAQHGHKRLIDIQLKLLLLLEIFHEPLLALETFLHKQEPFDLHRTRLSRFFRGRIRRGRCLWLGSTSRRSIGVFLLAGQLWFRNSFTECVGILVSLKPIKKPHLKKRVHGLNAFSWES